MNLCPVCGNNPDKLYRCEVCGADLVDRDRDGAGRES